MKAQRKYRDFVKNLLKRKAIAPREGKKEDPAHKAIRPTGQKPTDLKNDEQKLYDLIVSRFLACFGKPALWQSVTMEFDLGCETFIAKGKHTLIENWFKLYKPYMRVEEKRLPDWKEGQKLIVEDLNLLEKETKPPKATRRLLLKSCLSEAI